MANTKNPFILPKLNTLNKTMKIAQRKPPTGYTQGGSSRKDSGAKVAGKDATKRS